MNTPTKDRTPAWSDAGAQRMPTIANSPAEVSRFLSQSTRPRTGRATQPRKPAWTPEIEHQGNGVWLVESKTFRGVMHTVDAAAGTCDCPALQDWGKATCRHLDAVRPLWLAEQVRRAEEEAREAARRAAPVAAIQQRVVAQMGMLSPAQQATWRLLSDYGLPFGATGDEGEGWGR